MNFVGDKERIMSLFTVELPDDLAQQVRVRETDLPRIIELGLRELNASEQTGLAGAAELLEFLAALPSPEDIISLRPSPLLQERISYLLEKNRNEALTAAEEREWEQYQYLEHLVRMAKARTHIKLELS